MKTNEKKELHLKTVAELRKLLRDAHEGLLSIKLEFKQSKLSNTSSLFLKRQEIAILQTILKEKLLREGIKSGAQGDKKTVTKIGPGQSQRNSIKEGKEEKSSKIESKK